MKIEQDYNIERLGDLKLNSCERNDGEFQNFVAFVGRKNRKNVEHWNSYGQILKVKYGMSKFSMLTYCHRL